MGGILLLIVDGDGRKLVTDRGWGWAKGWDGFRFCGIPEEGSPAQTVCPHQFEALEPAVDTLKPGTGDLKPEADQGEPSVRQLEKNQS